MIDFTEMEDIDLKLNVLSGNSLKIGTIEVKPFNIREVTEFGYSNYMRNLQWLTVTIDEFIKSVVDLEKRMLLEVEKSKLKTFDFYTKLGGQEMLEGLMDSIAMIMKTDDVRLIEGNVIAIDFVKNGVLSEDEDGEIVVDQEKLEEIDESEFKIIHRDNFDDFVEAVKIINYLKKPTKAIDKEDNPSNDETRKLMEQMKKNRERVNKIKKKSKENSSDDDDDFDLTDIISSVTVKSNSINKFNVWDLTLAQLYDEYARLELIDNYDFSIKAMMAGAEKIDLKHWSSRL